MFKKEFKCQCRTRGVAVDRVGTLHVATHSGLETFSDELELCSNTGSFGDVALSQKGCRFVTNCVDGRLEIRKVDDNLIGTIHGLKRPLGVFLDQSGYIHIADYETNKVCKY